jgi:hypothetical protein
MFVFHKDSCKKWRHVQSKAKSIQSKHIKKTLITNKCTKSFIINCNTFLHVSTLLGDFQEERFVRKTTSVRRCVSSFQIRSYPLKAEWLLSVQQYVKCKNSTFCPHSVFMCFVWISEQTAIISLYNINWLVFITESECVYCAVRTESLNKFNSLL